MPRGKKLNFKSMDAYRRYLAFKHIHLPGTKSDEKISIRGKPHKVKHGR
jgi:hypothetical protein